MYSVCITADKATGVLFYNLLPCIFSLSAIVEFFYFSPSVPLLHELHSMPYWMCCVTPALVLNPILLFSSGDCNFEGPYTACGYSQGKDDDFEWEQANTMERPSPNPWMPTGQSLFTPHHQTESPWKTEHIQPNDTLNKHLLLLCYQGKLSQREISPTGNDCLLQIRWFLF